MSCESRRSHLHFVSRPQVKSGRPMGFHLGRSQTQAAANSSGPIRHALALVSMVRCNRPRSDELPFLQPCGVATKRSRAPLPRGGYAARSRRYFRLTVALLHAAVRWSRAIPWVQSGGTSICEGVAKVAFSSREGGIAVLTICTSWTAGCSDRQGRSSEASFVHLTTTLSGDGCLHPK